MKAKKRGLGKNIANLGLKELLSDLKVNEEAQKDAQKVPAAADLLQKLPIEVITPGKYQPRKAINQEALEDLANSIRTQGLLQPIIVRLKSDQKTYEIIAGERRWRAAQLAGLHEVPIILRSINDEQALAISLIENIQRENLNVMDEAEALQRLSEEFSLTHREVADIVGKSRTTVTNLLRLLGLKPEVKELVKEDQLEMGHARALLALPALQQAEIAKTVISKGLSVRETERLVNNLQNKKPAPARLTPDANILQLQKKLAEKLGAKVTIQQKTKSKGRLIIQYHSLAELDGILEHIK